MKTRQKNSPGFRVEFRKQIHGSFSCVSSCDIYLVRVLSLPFAPYAGLHVSYGDWSEEITEVVFDAKAREFTAYTQEDKEIYEAQLRRETHRPIGEIVKEYTAAGWRLGK